MNFLLVGFYLVPSAAKITGDKSLKLILIVASYDITSYWHVFLQLHINKCTQPAGHFWIFLTGCLETQNCNTSLQA